FLLKIDCAKHGRFLCRDSHLCDRALKIGWVVVPFCDDALRDEADADGFQITADGQIPTELCEIRSGVDGPLHALDELFSGNFKIEDLAEEISDCVVVMAVDKRS